MVTTLSVQGTNIQLDLREHKVKVTNNDDLRTLLAHQTEAATDVLVAAIKQEFKKQFNRELNISSASMSVEIWGHIYTEHFATAIKYLAKLRLIDNIADKVVDHCEVIDIGESGHDTNRFVWDGLSSFKGMIAGLLPKS
ncbi:MAG: hypothetical protein ABI921_05610 [Panacibacter sp.]